MSLLTAEEVTNLYLYGNKTKPADIETETLIRDNPLENPTTTSVDINEYMTIEKDGVRSCVDTNHVLMQDLPPISLLFNRLGHA